MQRMARTLLVFSLVALLVSPLTAQEEKKKKRKKSGDRNPAASLFQLPKEVQSTLTGEQKEKVAGLIKEYGPKLIELFKAQASVLTDEQRQARAAALKKARDDGKKGREIQQAANDAVQLSDDQKQKMTELGKQRRELQQSARKALEAVLTDEQKAKIKTRAKKKKKDAAGE